MGDHEDSWANRGVCVHVAPVKSVKEKYWAVKSVEVKYWAVCSSSLHYHGLVPCYD
jgi:hypothetical protein